MIRINLLPHREIKRKERRQQFYLMSLLMVIAGLGVGFAGHTYLTGLITHQEGRNAFVRAASSALDQQIGEIRELRQQIDILLARKQIIDRLQSNRAETVHLFNELVERVPEGVSLTSLRQSDGVVTLTGQALSNARVSHLMRNIDQSDYLGDPRLIEVRSVVAGNRRVSEFTLNIRIKRPGEGSV